MPYIQKRADTSPGDASDHEGGSFSTNADGSARLGVYIGEPKRSSATGPRATVRLGREADLSGGPIAAIIAITLILFVIRYFVYRGNQKCRFCEQPCDTPAKGNLITGLGRRSYRHRGECEAPPLKPKGWCV
jgi:hypothetical protein